MPDAAAQGSDSEFARPPSAWVKWGKIGDTFKGKFLNKYEKDNAFKPGEKQWCYEIEVEEGSYHNIEDKVVASTPTIMKAGDVYSVSGKKIIDNVMSRCAVGQRCKMTYTADFTKDAKTSKTISVLLDTKFVAPVVSEDKPF